MAWDSEVHGGFKIGSRWLLSNDLGGDVDAVGTYSGKRPTRSTWPRPSERRSRRLLGQREDHCFWLLESANSFDLTVLRRRAEEVWVGEW